MVSNRWIALSICLLGSWGIAHCGAAAPPTPRELLQAQAQELADDYFGAGQARVTLQLEQGWGSRSERRTVLGREGFVTKSSEKRERFCRSSLSSEDGSVQDEATGASGGAQADACSGSGGYENSARTEQLELPRQVVATERSVWTEQISVAVVLRKGRPVPADFQAALKAGLGLNEQRGDQLCVVSAAL